MGISALSFKAGGTCKILIVPKPYLEHCLKGHNSRIFRIFLLCWGLTTRPPIWVILCPLPEKGRKKIEEIVEEMKERDRKKDQQERKRRNRRNKNIPFLPLPAKRIVGLAQL